MDNPEELTTLGTQDEGRTTQYEKNMFLKVNQKSVLIGNKLNGFNGLSLVLKFQ